MWHFLIRDFKDRKVATISYSAISIGLLVLYIALFPSIKAQSSNYAQLFNSFPAAFQKAFNFDTSIFSSLEGFLATEKFSITWQVLAILLVCSRAGLAIAGEIEHGTMAFLLSQPISRLKLYLAKYLSGLMSLVVFIIASTLTIVPLAMLFHVSYTLDRYPLLSLICLLFAWSIYAFAFLCSAMMRDRSHVYFVVGGSLVVMYVVDIVSKLKTSLNFLGQYTIFHYFNVAQVFVHGRWNPASTLFFTTIIVLASMLGAFIFTQRDI